MKIHRVLDGYSWLTNQADDRVTIERYHQLMLPIIVAVIWIIGMGNHAALL